MDLRPTCSNSLESHAKAHTATIYARLGLSPLAIMVSTPNCIVKGICRAISGVDLFKIFFQKSTALFQMSTDTFERPEHDTFI